MSSLTVLIVNRSMHATSGTELYVCDVALELQRQGHRPIVFTPTPGSVSEPLVAAGIRVVADVEELDAPPDVIHGQHAWTTLAVLVRFPTTPAIFVGHDATAWTDFPPRLPQIRRYVAVDHALFRRFSRKCAIPESLVKLIPNAIDFRRFRRRGPLPEKPKRALLISNYSGPIERGEIQAACDARGISLDAVGRRFGNMTSRPEDLYGLYDLVFAKGRCLLEAAASGTAVVYCDTLGCGPLLTRKVLEQGKGILAGRQLLSEPLERRILIRRIDTYDPREALFVSAHIRANYDSKRVVSQLVNIYREAIVEYQHYQNAESPEKPGHALAREMIRWSEEAEAVFQCHFEAMAKLLPDESGTRQSAATTANCVPKGAVASEGWNPAERDAQGDFWWIGPDPVASVDLTVPQNGATHLRCHVAHAMDQELMRKLEIQINGQPAIKRFERDEGPVISVALPDPKLMRAEENVRVLFVLPKTIRPSEDNAKNSDRRLLGIALRRVALENKDGERWPLAHPVVTVSPPVILPMPFIFGSPRSGTTLLRMMLDAHPELAVPPGTGFLAMASHLSANQVDVVEALFELVTGYPAEAPGWYDFKIPADEFRRRLQTLVPFSISAGFRLFYQMYSERFGKSRCGDKTPLYGHHLKLIEEVLPEARFIHIVRDGRDAALSLRKLWFSPGHDVRIQANYWRNNILAARRQGEQCRHFLEIRYEDLIRNTELELRRICAFIEIDFHVDMLVWYKQSARRIAEDQTRHRKVGNVLAEQSERLQVQRLVMSPPEASRIGVWQAELTRTEKNAFESIAGEILSEYGYEPASLIQV